MNAMVSEKFANLSFFRRALLSLGPVVFTGLVLFKWRSEIVVINTLSLWIILVLGHVGLCLILPGTAGIYMDFWTRFWIQVAKLFERSLIFLFYIVAILPVGFALRFKKDFFWTNSKWQEAEQNFFWKAQY